MTMRLKHRRKLFFPEFELRRRELGITPIIGWENSINHSLYTSFETNSNWTIPNLNSPDSCGGIYNLEFSPDGKELIAACEKKALLVYDPISRKRTFKISDAHEDCVNGVKFMDDRLFASCSDDTTVALWDLRNLNKKVAHLKKHSNWVKNIDYDPTEGILLTSAFDGNIIGWNINDFTDEGLKNRKLYFVEGLMRMKLNPDCSKLIICTLRGFITIIHNLSLTDLLEENTELDINDSSTKNNKNLIETVTDFPSSEKAEMIHSLQIHPHGWCALSRNTTNRNVSEWLCIHDIQDVEYPTAEEPQKISSPCRRRRLIRRSRRLANRDISRQIAPRPAPYVAGVLNNVFFPLNINLDRRYRIFTQGDGSDPSLLNDEFYIRSRGEEELVRGSGVPRLKFFAEEINTGHGFIKEVCFSSDGRVICSPYHKGIRLLMFDQNCSEMSHCVDATPKSLHIGLISRCHNSCVVSTKFAPFDYLLVSGNLGGEIVWHQPVL